MILLSANALNLFKAKILLFGKELNLYHTILSFKDTEENNF